MLTHKDVNKYLEVRILILKRIKEIAKILNIYVPTVHSEYVLHNDNVLILGRKSFPTEYLCESNEYILNEQDIKKKNQEDRVLQIKKMNAIEGYKENLELIEFSKKELLELGVDPDSIEVSKT